MPTLPASRIEQFEVLIPAGTAKAAPLEVATAWNPGELVGVRIRIPRGHSFLTGIQLLVAHAQALPITPGGWIVGDDDEFETDLLQQLNTGAWSARGYNVDLYPHTFHVTYYIQDFSVGRPQQDESPIAPLLLT